MQRAFETSIKTYLLNGEKVQAPTTAPSVPKSIASAVTAVEGLDTADVARPQSALQTPPSLQTVMRGTGDTGTVTSAAGYDDSTGLGSPNGASFLSALAR